MAPSAAGGFRQKTPQALKVVHPSAASMQTPPQTHPPTVSASSRVLVPPVPSTSSSPLPSHSGPVPKGATNTGPHLQGLWFLRGATRTQAPTFQLRPLPKAQSLDSADITGTQAADPIPVPWGRPSSSLRPRSRPRDTPSALSVLCVLYALPPARRLLLPSPPVAPPLL